jgi:hypothetical protein
MIVWSYIYMCIKLEARQCERASGEGKNLSVFGSTALSKAEGIQQFFM